MSNQDLRSQMQLLLEQWHASGKSLRAFAEESGTTYWKLNYWKKSLGMTRSRRPEPRLARVQIVDPVSAKQVASAGFEIMMKSGHRIVVPHGFDATELSRLMMAVAAC